MIGISLLSFHLLFDRIYFSWFLTIAHFYIFFIDFFRFYVHYKEIFNMIEKCGNWEKNLKGINELTLNMTKRVKKKENDQQTENLQLFLKTGNGSKKRGNWSTNWELKTVLENRKLTPKMRKRALKKEETDQQTENLKLFFENRKWIQKKRKPINKLSI